MRNLGGVIGRFLALLCIAALTACGGGGGGGGGGSTDSKLFVGDSVNHVIGALANANPPAGPITIDRMLDLGTESLGMTLDTGNDTLYIATPTSIRRVTNAGTATGNVTSLNAATILSSGLFNGLYLDTANNRMYVSDRPNGIRVYANARTMVDTASTPNLPTRTFFDSTTAGFATQGIAVDVARNIAYVLVTGTSVNAVYVYDNASVSTLDGNVAPTRVITLSSSVATSGLVIDPAHDRLYVGTAGSRVVVFDGVSTKFGTVTPDKTIVFPGTASAWTKVALDTVNDRLYAVTGASIFILGNASTATGSVAAKQVNAINNGSLTSVAVRP